MLFFNLPMITWMLNIGSSNCQANSNKIIQGFYWNFKVLRFCLTADWHLRERQWGPGTKISPGGATVIRNRKFAPYWRSPLRQLLQICFVRMNISHGPFPNCERSWEEGMCACREEKKTSSPGKMHVLRTHFSTSRHTTLRHFHCIKINAEDSLLRFHKVKPVGLSKLPVPLTVAPPGESAIVPGPHLGFWNVKRELGDPEPSSRIKLSMCSPGGAHATLDGKMTREAEKNTKMCCTLHNHKRVASSYKLN